MFPIHIFFDLPLSNNSPRLILDLGSLFQHPLSISFSSSHSFLRITPSPSTLSSRMSCSISSLARTLTRLRLAGRSAFVHRDATKASDAARSSTFVIPTCRRLRFSALFLDLDSSACLLLPPSVIRLTHARRGTENPPTITSKEDVSGIR